MSMRQRLKTKQQKYMEVFPKKEGYPNIDPKIL